MRVGVDAGLHCLEPVFSGRLVGAACTSSTMHTSSGSDCRFHLAHDLGAMVFNGSDAGAEHVGDHLVRVTGKQDIEHFAFARCQQIQPLAGSAFNTRSAAMAASSMVTAMLTSC